MKTEKSILTAFILNSAFSVFEFFGGVFTGSVAIVSDAIHDLGDAAGLGISYFFENKSKKQPDEKYTYGYARYSALGGVITTFMLIFGSAAVVFNAVNKLINPSEINYHGMIIFSVVGISVNFCAAYFTRNGKSQNQKAVNLHMIEDVFGWMVTLLGAITMRFTDWLFVDPVLSIVVSAFIFASAVRNLKESVGLFLDKTPCGIDIRKIEAHISELDGVISVHHIHIWSLDGQNSCATMHVVTDSDFHITKGIIREELQKYGVNHVTLELETEDERCPEAICSVQHRADCGNIHHHHG